MRPASAACVTRNSKSTYQLTKLMKKKNWPGVLVGVSGDAPPQIADWALAALRIVKRLPGPQSAMDDVHSDGGRRLPLALLHELGHQELKVSKAAQTKHPGWDVDLGSRGCTCSNLLKAECRSRDTRSCGRPSRCSAAHFSLARSSRS